MSLVRITVTVPADLVEEADRRAQRDRRSRSWVVAEALRHHLLPSDADGLGSATASSPEGTPISSPQFADDAARVREIHLESELALSPSARMERAEELGELARAQQGTRSRGREQVIAFETYDDYYRWKTARLIGA